MRQLSVFVIISVLRISSQFVITCNHPDDTNLRGEREKRSSYMLSATLWPGGVVPYEKVGTIDSNLFVSQAIAEIETATCVTFTDVSSQGVETLGLSHTRTLLIKDLNNGGCSSDIGKTGNSGTQDLFLDQSCVNGMSRTTVHEFLHALGFKHEFRRTDRDFYVNVYPSNVQEGKLSQFSEDTPLDMSKRYDISSIMQYTGRAFATSGVTMDPVASILSRVNEGRDNLSGFVRGDNVALSHRDKASINELYNCATCSDTCQNGGYMNSDCNCQCPFGFTGTLCEILDTTGVDGGCGSEEISATSGTITPPQEGTGYKFNVKCIWRIKGSTPSQRVRVKLTSMTIDSLDGGDGNKRDGACGLGTDKDSLFVYLYGTDVEVYPVSCKSADQTKYLNQWSISDTNQVIIYWVSDGTFFDFRSDPSFITSSVTAGWSLDYEIGTLDGDNNFVLIDNVDDTTDSSNADATTDASNNADVTTDASNNADVTTDESNIVDDTTDESNNVDMTTEDCNNEDSTTEADDNVDITRADDDNIDTTTDATTTVKTTASTEIDLPTVQISARLTSVQYVDDYNDMNSAASQTLQKSFIDGIDPIMRAVNPSYIRSEVTGFSKGSVVVAYKAYFSSEASQTTGQIQTKLGAELERNNNQIGQFTADPDSLSVISGRCDGMNCNQATSFARSFDIVLLLLLVQLFFIG